MPFIRVRDRDGVEHEIAANPGQKVMEILREADYGVAAACGGMCSCGTCHVLIHPDWMVRLPPPLFDEIELIAGLPHATPQSRLSCQIEFTAALDDLQVTIAPEE